MQIGGIWLKYSIHSRSYLGQTTATYFQLGMSLFEKKTIFFLIMIDYYASQNIRLYNSDMSDIISNIVTFILSHYHDINHDQEGIFITI